MEVTALKTLKPKNKDAENKAICKALINAKKPLTRRQINHATGYEIGNLCRALYNLVNKTKVLKISHYANCATTNKIVMHFYFNDTLKLGGGANE